MCKVSIIKSDSAEQTESFGEKIGRKLRGGEVIELVSDLAGGKTTLTRGIARGAGSGDTVGSPTFMISKIYKSPKLDIHHFDFYRLTEPGLIEHELQETIDDPAAAIIVEWGEVIQHVLPERKLTINIKKTSDNSRQLKLTYPIELSYLVNQT